MDEKKCTLRFELLHGMNHKGHDTKRLGIEGTPSPRKEISLSLLFLSHSHLQSLLHQESELSLEFTHFSARKAHMLDPHIPKSYTPYRTNSFGECLFDSITTLCMNSVTTKFQQCCLRLKSIPESCG